jgi:hypothetical protein
MYAARANFDDAPFTPPYLKIEILSKPQTEFDVCQVQIGGGGPDPAKKKDSAVKTSASEIREEIREPYGSMLIESLRLKVMRTIGEDKPNIRHGGASDVAKFEFATRKQISDALATCVIDIDFVSITGHGRNLLSDVRIRDLLNGGICRVFNKTSRQICRRQDGGFALTIGVFNNWCLGKPLSRGRHTDDLDDFMDSADQEDDDHHLRSYINGRLRLFDNFYSNGVLRFSLLDTLAEHFGNLELNLYRIGVKHEVTGMLHESSGLVGVLETLRTDFKVDMALAITMKIDSCYLGVDKHYIHKKHLFACSNQDNINNVLMPDGHDSIENMYRLCIYNDMIHNASLKSQSAHAIEVEKFHDKDEYTTSLLHMTFPSILKRLEDLEDGLFKPNAANRQTWIERSALRCEMYFRLRHEPVNELKKQMENFVVEHLVVSLIPLSEMQRFLQTRLSVFKNLAKLIWINVKSINDNQTVLKHCGVAGLEPQTTPQQKV